MSAAERLAPLLTVPVADSAAPWLDLVEGRPGSRGRVQDFWESGGGSGFYDLLLATGDRFRGWVPDVLGGRPVREFYEVPRRLGLVGGETVLDLACGPGTLTRHVADAVGPDGLVIGADLSPAMLDRASAAGARDNAVFARMDAMRLPLRDAAVDALACSLCLHLVPDLDTTVDEIARVLRPGGRLAATVPAHGSGPLRRLTGGLARNGQVRLFEPGELARVLERHGFTAVTPRVASLIQIVDATAPGTPPRAG